MAVIVENGSNVSGANSYMSEASLTAYATARGITLVGDETELLIKAMDYIESLNYKGSKLTRDQGLQWPRYNVLIDGYYFDSDAIPVQLINGQAECAIAIDQGDDPLQNLQPKVLSEKVDVIEVSYQPSGSQIEINRRIKNALWKLLATGGNSGNTINVSRG